VVKDAKGAAKEYYIAKNDVSEKFGHTCKGESPRPDRHRRREGRQVLDYRDEDGREEVAG